MEGEVTVETHNITFTVTTPMFLGGLDATRPVSANQFVPSLRGALRFWFRAINGRHYGNDTAGLFRAESEIFGAATNDTEHWRRSSPVRLRVVDWKPRPGEGGEPLWLGRRPSSSNPNWMVYLLGQGLAGLPPAPQRPRLSRPNYLDAGSTIVVRLQVPDVTTRAKVESCIWALARYGGLGARAGRGFGGVAIDGLTNFPAADTWRVAEVLELHDVFTDPQRAPRPERPTYPTLGPFASIVDVKLGKASWDAAALEMGERWRRARATEPAPHAGYEPRLKTPEWLHTIHGDPPNDDFPLGALGLPVGFKEKQVVNLFRDNNELRRKSPIQFSLHKFTDGWGFSLVSFETTNAWPGTKVRYGDRKGHRTLKMDEATGHERLIKATEAMSNALPPR